MNKQSILWRTGFAFLAQLCYRIVPMMLAVLIARSLTTQEFASYSYFRLTVELISSYAALGMATVTARSVATLENRPIAARAEVSIAWVISLLLALFTFTGIAFAGQTLVKGEVHVLWYALSVCIVVLGIVPNGILLGREKFGSALIVALVATVVTLLLGALAFQLESIWLAVFSLVCFYAVRTIGETIFALRSVGKVRFPRLSLESKSAAKSVVQTMGILSLVSMVAATGPWLLGRLVLEYGGSQDFAVFAIGLQWYGLAVFVPGLISRVLFAEQVRGISHGDFSLISLYKTVTTCTILALIVVIVVWLVQDRLIQLYGDSYAEFSLVIPAAMLAGAIRAGGNPVAYALVAIERSDLQFLSTIIWLATSVAVFFLASRSVDPVWRALLALAVGGGVHVATGIFFMKLSLLRRDRR